MRWLAPILLVGCSFREGVKPTGDGSTGDDTTTGDVIDAPPCPGDRDCDGVADDDDNCPDVTNAMQDNEDGDKLGDICDPCPPDKNDTPPDGDGDGVGDACDPHPGTPGDQIVVFEGFHHGLPPAWPSAGTWTAMDDTISSNSTDTPSWLVTPFAATGRETISTGMHLDSKVSGRATAGITDMHEVDGDDGVVCGLYDINFIFNFQGVGMATDDLNTNHTSATPYSMTTNKDYAISFARDGTNYACAVSGSQGSASATGPFSTMHAPFGAGIRLSGASAHFAWLMIVTSP